MIVGRSTFFLCSYFLILFSVLGVAEERIDSLDFRCVPQPALLTYFDQEAEFHFSMIDPVHSNKKNLSDTIENMNDRMKSVLDNYVSTSFYYSITCTRCGGDSYFGCGPAIDFDMNITNEIMDACLERKRGYCDVISYDPECPGPGTFNQGPKMYALKIIKHGSVECELTNDIDRDGVPDGIDQCDDITFNPSRSGPSGVFNEWHPNESVRGCDKCPSYSGLPKPDPGSLMEWMLEDWGARRPLVQHTASIMERAGQCLSDLSSGSIESISAYRPQSMQDYMNALKNEYERLNHGNILSKEESGLLDCASARNEVHDQMKLVGIGWDNADGSQEFQTNIAGVSQHSFGAALDVKGFESLNSLYETASRCCLFPPIPSDRNHLEHCSNPFRVGQENPRTIQQFEKYCTNAVDIYGNFCKINKTHPITTGGREEALRVEDAVKKELCKQINDLNCN